MPQSYVVPTNIQLPTQQNMPEGCSWRLACSSTRCYLLPWSHPWLREGHAPPLQIIDSRDTQMIPWVSITGSSFPGKVPAPIFNTVPATGRARWVVAAGEWHAFAVTLPSDNPATADSAPNDTLPYTPGADPEVRIYGEPAIPPYQQPTPRARATCLVDARPSECRGRSRTTRRPHVTTVIHTNPRCSRPAR